MPRNYAMKLITLQQWNDALFGGRYTLNTLRAWARSGCISPAPQKVGKDWMVLEQSQYRKPKASVKIPANVDLTMIPTDPVVLQILNRA